MPYATRSEFKVFVGIPDADVVDDAAIDLALEAATAQVEGFTDRTFTADATPVTRWYSASETGALVVDPISTTTGLVVATDENGDGVAETAWTLSTDYRLEPVNAELAGEPWTRIVALGTRWFPRPAYRPGVSVTARFGWPGGVAPAPVKLATLIQASRLFKRKDAPFGVAGSVEFGSEMRLLNEVDRDAQNLLRPYRRSWYVVA